MSSDYGALANELVEISRNSLEFAETQSFKLSIISSVSKRNPSYLNAAELEEIIKWKLDSQYHRSRALRGLNLDNVVVPVTRACLQVSSEDFDYALELKIRLLSTLRGIATPLASAVLAILEPDRYAVIDSLLWSFFTGLDKSSFSVSDYRRFLSLISDIAKLTGLTMQETEHALWIYVSTK